MAFDSGLLSQIANPQMPDIAGALDFRQKRLQEEQQRQKDAKMKELFSQSVLPNLREGSVQYEMAKEDPERFIAYSKAMGVPVDKASMLEQQSKDVYALSNIIDKNDPQGALQFAQTLIAEREGQGLNADREKKWLSGAMEEFNTTGSLGRSGNAIKMMNETMNGDLIAKAKEAKRKADLEERGMKVDERQVAAQEVAARQQSAASSRPTANAQDLATYKAMKAAGDPDAEGFGRSIGIISKEGEKLSAFAEKAIADSADAANVSRSSAAKYTALADNLRKASDMKGGLQGKWGEWIKEQTGNKDELTALRKEALGITNSEAIASLPPGPATDRDIEMAKAPFPTEKSDPKYVADWLSAVSRLQQKKAEYAEFKADFISKYGSVRGDGKSLSAAWRDSQKQAQQSGANGEWSIRPAGGQ
jgi:hypothetical protein